MSLERQTEKVLRVAEALFRQPLVSAFPLPGELADGDLHARLERVLSRALQGGAAPAEASPPSEPVRQRLSAPDARPDLRGTAGAFPRARSAVPLAASSGFNEAATLQLPEPAGMAAHATHVGASSWSPGEGSGLPRGNAALQGSLESDVRARAPAPSTNFPERGTVAGSLGFPSVPMHRTPAPTVDALVEQARPFTLTPVVSAERAAQAPVASAMPSPRSLLTERAVFEEGPRPVSGEGASGSRSVRMVSSPAELAALLRSHVDAPEALPPRPPGRDAAPEAAVVAGPGPARASPGVHVPEPVSLPEVSFTGPAREGGAGGAAEELLLDKLLDRFQDRLREESIRRFGLSGGDL
ncbi:hypothetical protein [Pyxidicoccus sp. MSG2]|uniref:hypothetical protein n=1 Tax=Pyxidicoccus sp. MSG2 TaxID=2996790 RepID=UPI00226E3634|nr:hypothetical protein [Pyxidicoccus sp. MSG2]MCY1022304.1 hypothetical protein [Pyxidicoccus sp. MSG2]